MLVAIEIKVSERYKGRLRPKETIDDILKLDAHRLEARHREFDFLPAVMIVDAAPDPAERMRSEAVDVTRSAAEERGICFFYLSQ